MGTAADYGELLKLDIDVEVLLRRLTRWRANNERRIASWDLTPAIQGKLTSGH